MRCSKTRTRLTLSVAALVSFAAASRVQAHCEVPCGIYGDQQRFETMLEHQTTIAKSITSITQISGQMQSGADPLSINQVVRWVNNKEKHATEIQHIIAQYFLTQRIKADKPNYTKQLQAAHAVMVWSMKCKQDADLDNAEGLKKAILDFYRAYEGREPDFHSH